MWFSEAPNRTNVFCAAISAAVLTGCFSTGLRAQAVAVAEVDGFVTNQSGQAAANVQVRITETDKDQLSQHRHRCYRSLRIPKSTHRPLQARSVRSRIQKLHTDLHRASGG